MPAACRTSALNPRGLEGFSRESAAVCADASVGAAPESRPAVLLNDSAELSAIATNGCLRVALQLLSYQWHLRPSLRCDSVQPHLFVSPSSAWLNIAQTLRQVQGRVDDDAAGSLLSLASTAMGHVVVLQLFEEELPADSFTSQYQLLVSRHCTPTQRRMLMQVGTSPSRVLNALHTVYKLSSPQNL